MLYSHTRVLSPRTSQKTSCSRHKVHKVQVDVSFHLPVISRGGVVSSCHLELYPQEISQSVEGWANSRVPMGVNAEKKRASGFATRHFSTQAESAFTTVSCATLKRKSLGKWLFRFPSPFPLEINHFRSVSLTAPATKGSRKTCCKRGLPSWGRHTRLTILQ